MKYLSFIVLLGLCGCDGPSGSVRVETDFGSQSYVQFVTNQGHVFCIAGNGDKIALCEVTDASLVEKK